jgi:hypothetical protein
VQKARTKSTTQGHSPSATNKKNSNHTLRSNIHLRKYVRKYLNVVEYVLCGGSDDDGSDCGVFVLLLAEHNDLPSSDLSHFNSKDKVECKR